MQEWMKKINDNTSPSPNAMKHLAIEHSLLTSTPSRFRDPAEAQGDFLRLQDLNMSNISSFSAIGGVSLGFDINLMQEQMNELQHQNKKLNEMLADVKNQLMVSEEQNTVLQGDLEGLNKKLQTYVNIFLFFKGP